MLVNDALDNRIDNDLISLPVISLVLVISHSEQGH